MTRPDEGLVSALREGLVDQPRVVVAFLFGSRATGRARERSDIDLAVLLDPPPRDSADRNALIRGLAAAVGRSVSAERLDLVLLDDAPNELAFQVLRDGVEVLCRDALALHRFKVRTWRVHGDYEPWERFWRERTRRQLLGAPGG